MIGKQKKLIFILVSIFVLAFSFISFSYVNESNQIKKVISLVYDDSGSMSNNGQDFAYASYGLQNIIGLMNPYDKLNVVKMSDKDRNIPFHIDNYETRKAELESVKSYRATGTDTSFKTVETALEYLYDMKSMHGDDSSYEYYLVVLTDGQFDNYPKNLTEYLSQIPKNFGSSSYNGIFIGIGNNIPSRFEKDVLTAPNNYYVESDNNDEIVNALYVAHDIIYDRTVLREDEYKYDETNSSITFDPTDKINKVIVFEQNQQVAVTDVSTYDVKANEKLVFTGTKSVSPTLDSYIVHTSNELAQLPKEKVTINFLDKVDTSKKNLRVMVEYAGEANKKLGQSNASTDDLNSGNGNGNNSQGNVGSGDSGNVDSNSNGGGNGINSGNGIGDGTGSGNKNEQENSTGQSNNNSTGINENETGKHGLADDDSKVKKSTTNVEPEIEDKSALPNDNTNSNNRLRNDDSDSFTNPNDTTLIGLGGCACSRCNPYPNYYGGGIGLSGCTRCSLYPGYYGIGLGGCACTRCVPFLPYYQNGIYDPTAPYPYIPGTSGNSGFPYDPNNPNSPNNPNNPNAPYVNPWVYSIYSLILSILPALILLALVYGYLKKPRFDRKEHAFEKYEGKTQLDTGSMIKVNAFSKLVPYMAESGFGSDLAIKAAKKKDRIIIPKKYLTPDMKIENQEIDLTRDLQLFEDTALTKVVDGKVYKYIYRYHPILDKNN